MILDSREDYERLLETIIGPTKKYLDSQSSGVVFPRYYQTSYDSKIQKMESFSRLVWGFAFSKKQEDSSEIVFRKIVKGTDANNCEYWGDLSDYSQMIVEMLPVLIFCYKNIENYKKLEYEKKKNIEKWFYQINQVKVSNNNWQCFVVLINQILKKLGAQYSQKNIDYSLKQIDNMYLGNGWYSDGFTKQCDYYIAFAIHFYLLLYVYFEDADTPRTYEIKKRALAFSDSFISWFGESGAALPFGRSLTYKFAQSAFWAMMITANVCTQKNALYKTILNKNLRWWFQQDIFDENGLVQIGYAYNNQIFTEYYNGTGSSYWCLKAFAILLLPACDAIFKTKEIGSISAPDCVEIPEIGMTVYRNGGEPFAFVNGQYACNQYGQTECKYEKFVYSTMFPFSVSRSYTSIELLASDSNLAISVNGKDFIARHGCDSYINKNGEMQSTWIPFPKVRIVSIVLPGVPYHFRIHFVDSQENLIIYDHGFAMDMRAIHHTLHEESIVIENYNYVSEAVAIFGNGEPVLINAAPNTNIQYNNSYIPAIKWELRKGKHILIDAFCGASRGIERHLPEIQLSKDTFELNEHRIAIDASYRPPVSTIKIFKMGRKIKNKISRFLKGSK